MPKVSIIIPVYNVERFIEKCAISLFEQTLDDIEYVFVDDKSSDNSIGVLTDVLDRYPNRKEHTIIHRFEKNCGQAAVRKWGVQHSSGDYIIHCDSDDWVEKETYLRLYQKAIETASDIVFHGYIITNGKDHIKKSLNITADEESVIKEMLLGKVKASLCFSLIKRELYFEKYFAFPQGDMTEDMTTIVQLLYLSNKYIYLDEHYYYYYRHTDSITKDVTEKKCVKRYNDMYVNTKTLCEFFEKTGDTRYDEVLKIHLVECKFHLKTVAFKWHIYKLWISNFIEDSRIYLFSKYPSIKNKIIYILVSIGIYPVMLAFNHKLLKK